MSTFKHKILKVHVKRFDHILNWTFALSEINITHNKKCRAYIACFSEKNVKNLSQELAKLDDIWLRYHKYKGWRF